uniref:Uncharacterized protein n=1 Tax=viral metagenome TaxID=1070528 RepID=A0A6C0JXA1_9ZZZZ
METIDENKETIDEDSQVIENIGIELADVESGVFIDTEPNNSFSEIKSNYRVLAPPPSKEKMPTCGTWVEGCFYCCCMPLILIGDSCKLCFCCCGPMLMQIKQLYFFVLYLFTGELNSEAVEYKKYFNIKSTKDDQVNVPEILVTASSILFELYKTMIGSFLTVFTAQRCGQQTCTIWENIVPKNDLELAGIVINFLMATTLLIEYIFEIMREAYLIKYLKYDKSLANNGEHIAELYENTDKSIFRKLIPLYVIYIRFSYVVLLIYFVNVGLSAVIVAGNYYDNTSIFSFITNALFIIYKIYNVVEITSYRGDYFYSAYKRKNIHYNDIKPKYLLKNQPFTNCDYNSSLNSVEDSLEKVENNIIISENAIPENATVNNFGSESEGFRETCVERNSEEFIYIRPDNEVMNENPRIDIAPTQEESKIQEPIKNPTIQDIIAYLFTSTKEVVQKPPKSSDMDYIEELDELGLGDVERTKILKELYSKNYIDKMAFFEAMMVRRNNKS